MIQAAGIEGCMDTPTAISSIHVTATITMRQAPCPFCVLPAEQMKFLFA